MNEGSQTDPHEMQIDIDTSQGALLPISQTYQAVCSCGWRSKIASSEIQVVTTLFVVHVSQAIAAAAKSP